MAFWRHLAYRHGVCRYYTSCLIFSDVWFERVASCAGYPGCFMKRDEKYVRGLYVSATRRIPSNLKKIQDDG
jgi:hypothetical protein